MGAPPGTAGSVPVTTPFRIFINRRRSDSYAGRIYDALKAHSESWHVFMGFMLLSMVLCALAILGRLLTREGAYLASIARNVVARSARASVSDLRPREAPPDPFSTALRQSLARGSNG